MAQLRAISLAPWLRSFGPQSLQVTPCRVSPSLFLFPLHQHLVIMQNMHTDRALEYMSQSGTVGGHLTRAHGSGSWICVLIMQSMVWQCGAVSEVGMAWGGGGRAQFQEVPTPLEEDVSQVVLD